jgi:hypothetical protein
MSIRYDAYRYYETPIVLECKKGDEREATEEKKVSLLGKYAAQYPTSNH